MHEWPLVVYTLIAQTVAGAFVLLHLPGIRRKIDPELKGKTGLLLILAACAGTAVSFFHLGQPLRGMFVFQNFSGSWLSREIAAQLLFIAGMTLVFIVEWKLPNKQRLHRVLSLLAGCSGLFLVYCMSRIYMLPAIPVWNTVRTPISFFTTAAVLGPLVLLAISYNGFVQGGRNVHHQLLPLTAVGAMVRIFILFSRTGALPGNVVKTLLEFTAITIYVMLVAVSVASVRDSGFLRGRRRICLLLIMGIFAELITRAGFYGLHAGGGM